MERIYPVKLVWRGWDEVSVTIHEGILLDAGLSIDTKLEAVPGKEPGTILIRPRRSYLMTEPPAGTLLAGARKKPLPVKQPVTV